MKPSDTHDSGFSLLYVEDDAESRELLSSIIRCRYPDVRIYVANDGESGLESFKMHLPEIVITDINLPGTDGIRMAAEIKFLSPQTEIIALTAYTNTQHLIKAIEIGISHYILKPIDTGQIFRVIDKVSSFFQSKRAIEQQNEMIKNLIVELSQKATELEQANQELASFNRTVAHDLRTPITSISGFIQILLAQHASGLDDAGKEFLMVINREILRINGLISVLLKFSRQGEKALHKRWTDFSAMVNDIKDNLLRQEPGRCVQFIVSEGISGFCDSDLIRIVLENLVRNAWDSSALRDNVRIEFAAINQHEDLVYFVRDGMAGYADADIDKRPVTCPINSSENDMEGFGIALSTATRIIKRHGGRIWADGESGKGSSIYFTLSSS